MFDSLPVDLNWLIFDCTASNLVPSHQRRLGNQIWYHESAHAAWNSSDVPPLWVPGFYNWLLHALYADLVGTYDDRGWSAIDTEG